MQTVQCFEHPAKLFSMDAKNENHLIRAADRFAMPSKSN